VRDITCKSAAKSVRNSTYSSVADVAVVPSAIVASLLYNLLSSSELAAISPLTWHIPALLYSSVL